MGKFLTSDCSATEQEANRLGRQRHASNSATLQQQELVIKTSRTGAASTGKRDIFKTSAPWSHDVSCASIKKALLTDVLHVRQVYRWEQVTEVTDLS